MTNAKLQIKPQPSDKKDSQLFAFIGSIDVDAIPILEPLYSLPAHSNIELDFAQLERINSMGLAQLLKLFEHWQKHSCAIKIFNVNRMITVLFKMTGLTRFLIMATDSQQTATPEPLANDAINPVPAAEPSTGSTTAQPATAKAPAPATEQLAVNNATTAQIKASPLVSDALLTIQPEPSTEALAQQFDFIGMIDVNAIPVLAKLYALPPNCKAIINFAQIQRVNSMGLAQLLKLFEHWQKQHIAVRIINVNRMVEVLFKMTGLTRFLTDDFSEPSPPVAAAAQRPQTVLSNAPETRPAPPLTADGAAEKQAKLNLWISSQSSQQMNGWYFFNTYLQRHLGRESHLEIIHGAVNEQLKKRDDEMDIVFSKPFEATRLVLKHNFQPIMRPVDQTDEVTLLVRADDLRQKLTEFQGGKVVTAAKDNFVYLLGRFLLEQNEAALQDMEYLFSGHDIKALQTLLKGQADILFMLSETYRGLSGLSKKMLREIDQSETAFAFHLFSVSPQHAGLADKLTEILLNMNSDSQGRQVLLDLGIAGWVKPNDDEIAMLTLLFNRYAD